MMRKKAFAWLKSIVLVPVDCIFMVCEISMIEEKFIACQNGPEEIFHGRAAKGFFLWIG